jgi:hypothetical protein
VIAVRREHAALRHGSVETVLVDEAQRCYAFARRLDGEMVYAIFNASDSPASVTLDAEGDWRDALQGHADVSGSQLSVQLAARGCALLVRK